MATKTKTSRKDPRVRRKLRIRKQLSGTNARPRLSVFKSVKHTYAQLISDETGKTIAAASTNDAEVKTALGSINAEGLHNDSRSSKSMAAAKAVGSVLAKRASKAGVKAVVFDRNGFVYHGRIRAVADGAREGGLDF